MSPPRFFVPNLPEAGELELPAAESKHASGVLRLSAGDEVILFDGQGGEAQGSVSTTGSRRTLISIDQRTDVNRELAFELALCVALPKGERQRVLIEGLTQLGVSRLTPVVTQRGVAQPTSKTLERLRRFVIESSKQCGRNQLMEVTEPIPLTSLLESSFDRQSVRLFAHPGDIRAWSHMRSATGVRQIISIAIGPEGGFTPQEADGLATAGWMQMSLGPRILRVEMAAIASAVAVISQAEA